MRASYEADANIASAQTVYAAGGWGVGYGPGWFWNPYFATYSWLPGDGFFYSPFGYPFYSPAYVVYAPRYYAGRGYYGGHGYVGPHGYVGRTGVAASSFHGSSAPAAHFSGGGVGGGGLHGGGGRR